MSFNLEQYSKKINNSAAAGKLLESIFKYSDMIDKPGVNLMEVCGTHTHEIFKSGVKALLPKKIKLRSGPGCPVCVTPDSYIDGAINLAKDKNFIITTFGDMLKVPGASSSLKAEQSAGADVRVVYSPEESLEIAAANPDKNVVFLSVGFETTVPASAFLIKSAEARNLNNVYIYEANKTVPEAILAIAKHPAVKIDGFILPGHVSVIIGADAYRAAAAESGIPGVVCGFEYIDILLGINSLLEMIYNKDRGIRNEYPRVVGAAGNLTAQRVISEIFEPCDAEWRGIGVIAATGLKLREKYRRFSAGEKFASVITGPEKTKGRSCAENGCRCGEILLSIIEPPECPLFAAVCNPVNPIGPCMVSSEGVCAAYYKYGAAGAEIEL
ncbi:MAG TPA: hydrogenase formation protein HypD [Candidatus Wallbacteria bacterium]|nr:MAG: Hydrogenase isoenzymes formation protein HypD [bacterium ADurb.Bin243]HOD41715.1 hydrogenase formation protein HypD [Candidatus Wallbacteria bacterium]HPG56425.1 hydrogenase formation protein HypD [Candidatus Wallbacteria bacterium]